MARTTITKTTVQGPYVALPVVADSLDLSLVAADVSNKNQFAPTGDDLVIVQNSGASPYTFTITSVADPFKRTGDVGPYTMAAGEISAYRIKTEGWKQSDGFIYLEASNIAVKFAVLSL